MTTTLADALKVLEAGNTAEALEALLCCWREKRAPAIADVIDALAHAFPTRKFDGDGQNEWLELARRGSEGDVYALVATVLEAGPMGSLVARVEQLVERPDDPRIALAFARFAVEPPTTSSSNFPAWTKMFACIEATQDARTIPLLKKRAAMEPGTSKFWPKLEGWVERALKKLAPAPALSGDEAALLEKLMRAAKKAQPAKAVPMEKRPPAQTDGDPLERAIAAVNGNDLAACVEALLTGWRERRLVKYAEAIDRVTALHDERLACPGGKDPEVEKAWRALAARRRDIDVGRLAASVGDGKVGDVDKRLEEVLTWPADPRIARWMFTHFVKRTFSDRARTWGLVADLLVKNVDARFADELQHFDDMAGGDNKARRAAIRRAGPAALAALGVALTQPTPAELAAFERLEGALTAWDEARPASERRFLEAILADPESNAAALVYADWLSETGHPRGELILLQTAAKPDEARIKELVSQNARALLGPAACLPYSNLAFATKPDWFRRGLLRKVELREVMPAWFFSGQPLLWFIEEFNNPQPLDTAAAVVGTSRSLCELPATPQLLVQLASGAPLSAHTLRLSYAREAERPLVSLLSGLAGRGLSGVKHLEVFWSDGARHQDGLPDVLVASALFENLETLAVATANLETVLAALKKHGRTVASLSLLRRHYLRCRLDVQLDAQFAPTAITLRPVDLSEPCEVRDDDRNALSSALGPLVTALSSLSLPPKFPLTIADGVTLSEGARAAIANVVAV